MKTYKGLITKENLPEKGIFVFGSNPVGINGNPDKGTGGAALVALKAGWIEQGQKLDNCLAPSKKAWGLTTVTYPGKKRSVTPAEIQWGISKMYRIARFNPEYEFYVAYSGLGKNLNGYTNKEMADMFSCEPIPDNVVFEEGFSTLLKQNQNELL